MYGIKLNSLVSCVLLWFVFNPAILVAQHEIVNDVDLDKIPPRIIRACCAFGYDLKLWGVPFVNIDQVISVDDLGKHRYMGDKHEGIGTVYTKRGGFIDLGHVRDQIDWTRYLYTLILNHKAKGELILKLRKEAGRKRLHLNIPERFDQSDARLLAGKIAYDFSLWHEISTWFGASTVPFVKEKFSSFSVEDVYSNLLGIHIGMKSLHSELPFNQAATMLIKSTLDSLDVVKSRQETYEAYDAIHDHWYTRNKRIPRSDVTLQRDLDVLHVARPWLVSSQAEPPETPIILEVPLLNKDGDLLTDFYRFTIDPNKKLPVADLFPESSTQTISQDDFDLLLSKIARDLQVMEKGIVVENK